MSNMEYIDEYFKSLPTDEQKQQFEQRINNDISFAEDVAFYISANRVIKEDLQEAKKQKFRELYDQQKIVTIRKPVKKMWQYMAAASTIIAVILLTWFMSGQNTSTPQLADEYIKQNWQTLSVTMGSEDSLQAGLSLYNSGKFTEALVIFEKLVQNNTANTNAKKYAGIVCLRLGNYNNALNYFTMLETDTRLYSNPGKFYKAITLLKRNKNDDKKEAKLLLEEVVNKDMEGKSESEEWLKKL